MASGSVSGGGPVRRPPMPWWLAAFCWTVLLLDHIPRYGRYYRWKGLDEQGRRIRTKPHWQFTWWGRWGFSILVKMKLFFRYEDHLRSKSGEGDRW